MLKTIIYSFIVLLVLNPILAQERQVSITVDSTVISKKAVSQAILEPFIADADFDYETKKTAIPLWITSLGNDIAKWLERFFESLVGVEKAAKTVGYVLEYIPYVLFLLLAFVLYKFFSQVHLRGIINTQKNGAIVALSEEERIIKNENIPLLIQRALEEENYRMAVRYYYLHVLQLMSKKGIIAWEIQKTNQDYTLELQQPELIQPFANTTRLYNYFWYGTFPINARDYQKAERSFINLKNLITNA